MQRGRGRPKKVVEDDTKTNRALQIPLYRLRVDRAKELCSQRLRAWAATKSFEVRVSPGDEPTTNSHAEVEIGILKNTVRTLLRAANLDTSFWLLALRHGAEQRTRRQLAVSGLRLPALLYLLVAGEWQSESGGPTGAFRSSTPRRRSEVWDRRQT